MKKLISFLLVVMMLCTAAGAFADAFRPVEKDNVLTKFIKDTDFATKDIAVQLEAGKEVADLVCHWDEKNFHLVMRSGDKVEGHLQLNDTGMYLGEEGNVTLLKYDTVTNYVQDLIKGVDAALEEAVKSIPEDQIPSEEEVKKALRQVALIASVAAAREEADTNILSSAAVAFADKFKAENILDVKQEYGTVEVSLRSAAYASAMADAMDELMQNRDLAALVDRNAKFEGGVTFAEIQQNWTENREAVLETLRTVKSTETFDENGHMKSHFQIGKGTAEKSVLVYDNDIWLDVENDAVDFTVTLGFENEAPFIVYEFAVNEYRYWEKMTVGDSMAEMLGEIENNRLVSGRVITVINGVEQMRANFGPDYISMKGPKGSFSFTVRETWTGKTRYETTVENTFGDEITITEDFYEENDSLVCEMYTNKSFESVKLKLSRVDKINYEDLSAAEKITEITANDIDAGLEKFAKLAKPAISAAVKLGLTHGLWSISVIK